MTEAVHVETDVLVVGAGGAGMYAAIEAARGGMRVLLLDRSLVGRGGATVMAQMTVAVALGNEDSRLTMFRVAEKVMRLAGRQNGFDGDLHIAGGAVFKADGTGETRDQFAMDLAFGGAGADRSPTDKT